jgi:hypothetical protein
MTAKEDEGNHDGEDLELGFAKEWKDLGQVNVASMKGKNSMAFDLNKPLHKKAHDAANS